jgi:hypothetical protein
MTTMPSRPRAPFGAFCGLLALASCDTQIRVVDDPAGASSAVGASSPGGQGANGGSGAEGGSGGAGIGGQGGEAPLVLRPLTVRVERALVTGTLYALDTSPLEGLLVFSNAPDGSLLSTTTTGPGGVADIDGVDGGFLSAVSFVENDSEFADDEILSVRVLPGIESVRIPLAAAGYLGPEREPMSLRVEWDLVDDALYQVRASCLEVDVDEAQSSLDLPNFAGCPGSDEFVVVVEALLPGPTIYEPMVFGYVDDLPFVPGGELTVYVPLETGTEEATVFVTGATGPGKVTDTNHTRLLRGTGAGSCNGCGERELVEGGVHVTSLAAAFPELPAWTKFYRYGPCSATDLARVGPDFAPVEVAVSRLAGAVPAADADGKTGGWRLLEGEREIGDAMLLSAGWLPWWMLDPIVPERSLEGEGVPMLELPAEVLETVGPPPSDLTFTMVRHLDVWEATDFPTFLELFDSDQFHTQESSAWTCD